MAQQHSDAWYKQRNAAVGKPPGARHSDAWYEAELARLGLWGRGPLPPIPDVSIDPTPGAAPTAAELALQAQQAAAGTGRVPGGLPVDPNGGTPRPLGWTPWFDPGPVQIPPTPPVVTPPTPEQLATEAGARQRAALDAWDHLNSQRDYDADGWQSIGFQPDYIPMPAGWAENNWLPPKPPAVPPATPASPLVEGRAISAAANPLTGGAGWVPNTATPTLPTTNLRDGSPLSGPVLTGGAGWVPSASKAGGLTNALAQTATTQSANAWGSGQNPYAGMQPDPGAWGQSPPRQRNRTSGFGTGFGPPNQGFQSWSAPRQKRSGNVWGQQPAGTWGSGTV